MSFQPPPCLSDDADRSSMLSALRQLVHERQLLTAPEDLTHYGRDWTRQWSPSPSAIVFAESAQDVQRLVEFARAHRVGLVPSGGRTGLSGGAVATNGEIVLSTERLNRVIEFDPVDRSLRVEAGVVTGAVQEIAREHGAFFPVDFGSRGSSQIGGNVATNAGGINVLRYGLMRNWVSGLKVVIGTGDLLDLNRGLIKNASGPDFRHLFIGSEGTLGVIVEATLQLCAPPKEQQVMLFAAPDLPSIMEICRRARERLSLSAFEFFCERAHQYVTRAGVRQVLAAPSPFFCLLEFDSAESAALSLYEECEKDGLVTEAAMARSRQESVAIWNCRERITESLADRLPYKNDIAVRVSRVPAFVAEANEMFSREYPAYEIVWFGHVADGNLHISVLKPEGVGQASFSRHCERVSRLLSELLAKHGGSISAEHGVGLLKRPYLSLSRDPREIALMQQMKRIFDPDGILNPGKIFE